MSDITLRSRIIYEANIGAIICHTPKTSNDELVDDLLVDHHCMLIDNVDDFEKYFGDPYINPTEYSDAVMAHRLVKQNVRMYISSVDEMQHNNDGFNTAYNGYTEFYFLDSNKLRTVGYKLKSDIKFCQPIIQAQRDVNVLTLQVSLFLMNRAATKTNIPQGPAGSEFDPSCGTVNVIDTSRLYRTYAFDFDVSKVTIKDENDNLVEVTKTSDQDVIDALAKYGLELKPLNTFGTTSGLIDKFASYDLFRITEGQSRYPETVKNYGYNSQGELVDEDGNRISSIYTGRTALDYEYDLHADNYAYNFSDHDKIVEQYGNIIENMRTKLPAPLYLCLGRIGRSSTIMSEDESYIVRSVIGELNPYYTSVIQNLLLTSFDPNGTQVLSYNDETTYTEGCDTYLFINTPDIPVSSAYKWLNAVDEYSNTVDLLDHFNCDIYHGSIIEYENSTLSYSPPHRMVLQAATVVFYNLLLNSDTIYLTNAIGGLNIANGSIRTLVSESSAKKLADSRCNTIVTFDTGYPSTYGDRSLSTLPNLRYSHISRNFLLIRRLIKEYLETKKFILNTIYSTDICVSYITNSILEQFKLHDILRNYTIEKSISRQAVSITITLYFTQMAGGLNLDFTI